MIYDSAALRSPLDLRSLWQYRGLLALLVRREVTVRYKRSVLGVWWTLLNPLLATAVMWLIFSQIFRFPIPGVPYIVYLLTGVLLMTLFSQAVMATSRSIISNSAVLTKIYLPAEIYAIAAAVAAGINFVIGLAPLAAIQIATGVGVPWTYLLTPIPVLALLGLIIGIGLIVATAAIAFYDVLDLTAVITQLLYYLTPVFYPLAIVPERFQLVVQVNPLYSYLLVFREFAFGGSFAPWWAFSVMTISSLLVFCAGVLWFSRHWKNLVVLL